MLRVTLSALMASVLAGSPCDEAHAATANAMAVEVTNRSEPVQCAEKDNVTLAFASTKVRSFRIEAAHPVYLATGLRESSEADWTACDMSADPVHKAVAPPRKTVIYKDNELLVTGETLPAFWRPGTGTVRVGDRVEPDLHLLQVWLMHDKVPEEVLAIYPRDGYWRPRPLSPTGLKTGPFGSSFLIGPIEQKKRPFVVIKELIFDPKTRTFAVTFERGGAATVRIAEANTSRMALDVVFDRPIVGRPLAMLRSMYITEFNNDVARIAVRQKGAKAWNEENIMKFHRALATEVWAGRLSPSQHNTMSPDIVFNGFSDTAVPLHAKKEPPPQAQP